MSALSVEHKTRIYADQLRTVYFNFVPALLGTSLGAILLVALQWNVSDYRALLAWLIIFLVINSIRGLLVYQFKKNDPDEQQCQIWGKWFIYSSISAGMIWTIGVYVAFPYGNLPYQLTLAIIVVGLSAGATSTISVHIESFILFVFPMMVTLITLFILENNYSSYIVAITLVFTFLFVYRGAIKIYNSNLKNIELLIGAEVREKDLIKARNEAEKASLAKSDFLANMSHELRTPLHGILSFAQLGMYKNGDLPIEKVNKYFKQIFSSGERLRVLLDDLLDLSKLEAGKMELQMEYVSLHEIIDSCVGEQDARLQTNNLDVHCNYDTELPDILCDKNRIGQVVMNLLGNAIKFSPANGNITISTELSEGDADSKTKQSVAKFSIEDQGPGVSEDDQETIFRKFQQGKISDFQLQGTGLGLAISRELIHAHSGRIWCEPKSTRGALFKFVIPISENEQFANKVTG